MQAMQCGQPDGWMRGWGCAGAGGEARLGLGVRRLPSPPLTPHAATMGCCCSSDYDEDWIENIDICEHCNYPIEPDSKRQVRKGRADPPIPVAKRLWGWPGDG